MGPRFRFRFQHQLLFLFQLRNTLNTSHPCVMYGFGRVARCHPPTKHRGSPADKPLSVSRRVFYQRHHFQRKPCWTASIIMSEELVALREWLDGPEPGTAGPSIRSILNTSAGTLWQQAFVRLLQAIVPQPVQPQPVQSQSQGVKT